IFRTLPMFESMRLTLHSNELCLDSIRDNDEQVWQFQIGPSDVLLLFQSNEMRLQVNAWSLVVGEILLLHSYDIWLINLRFPSPVNHLGRVCTPVRPWPFYQSWEILV